MKNINKRSKSKKFFQRKTISVLCVFMAVLMCAGLLSSFVPSSRITRRPSTNKNSVSSDNVQSPTKEEIIESIVNKTMVVPKNGIELNRIDFSSPASSELSEIIKTPGFSYRGGLNFGNLTTENNYLEFSTQNQTSYNGSKSTDFGFCFLDEAKTGSPGNLDTNTVDYLTIECDMWSNTKYFDFSFTYFQGDSSSDLVLLPKAEFRFNGNQFYINNLLVSEYLNPIHLTFVIRFNHNGTADALLYLNGEFLIRTSNVELKFDEFQFLDVYIPSTAFAPDKSVCFDNYQVIGFGNGDGDYNGPISHLFETSQIKLNNCIDSVLYKR